MYRSNPSSVALAVLLCCAMAKEMTELEVLTSAPTRCTYEHAYEMYGAHCVGLRLNKIPNLKGGIEILDFSDNKLQELDANTLSSYTSIKFLYLSENKIYDISEDAFSSLSSLQTLDLSKNTIMTFPTSILQLPYLQNLYLSGNPMHRPFDSLAGFKDIRAPLQLLDMSDCKIKVLPEWGLLPQLLIYNISNNPLISIEAKHFAVMCNLARVDITKSIDNIRTCKLRLPITWFQEKQIYFQLDDYSKLNSEEFRKCSTPDTMEALNATYQTCKKEYLQVESRKGSRRTWLTISGGLAGFLVGFILLLYLMHRHNVAQTRKVKPKQTPDGDKKATAVLLNDVS